MANKNKNIKEEIYLDGLKGRWRFVKDVSQPWGAMWLMQRVKDGYRSYWPPENLVKEKK